MAKTLGLGGYSCRNRASGVPALKGYGRTAASTVEIKKGHPVVAAAAGSIARATVDATPVANQTAILGFSNDWDYYTSDLPRGFAIPPVIKDENGLQEIIVALAVPINVFTGRLRSTITAALTLEGVVADLWYDSTNDIFYIDTGSHVNDLVKVEKIVPGELGVAGGLVDFTVLDADSQVGDVAY